MSLPLIDLRAKITPESDAVLHKWAVAEIHAASVLQMILAREGLGGADEGGAGK